MRAQAIAIAALGCMALCACGSSPPQPGGDGVVVSGIQRCYALPTPSGATPEFVAGTIEVFRGASTDATPAATAAVAAGQRVTIRLPRGRYTLLGIWPESNFAPPTLAATVAPGQTTTAILVYIGCQ